MNSEAFNPWIVARYVAITVGVWTIVGWIGRGIWNTIRRALNRWVRPRLMARHHRQCDPLNAAWKLRVVRHAQTGRIGLCTRICTLESGWRDFFRPRWTADVVFHPAAARIIWAHRNHPFVVFATGCALERFPVGEITVAPAADAEEFRAHLESETDA